MPGQINKPDGGLEDDGSARPVDERQAVKNQGEVAPDDYPERAEKDATGAKV